jgi:hypothetical protein
MLFLDDEIKSQLTPELLDDEKLLWTGRPKKGIVFDFYDIFFIPFSIFWLYGVIESALPIGPDGFSSSDLFLVPFLLFGLFFLFGRFFWDSKKRSETIYGVTKNRILIKSGVFFKEVKSIDIKPLAKIKISERSDGYGTITFYTEFSWYDNFGLQPNWKSPMPTFDLIENPKEVYNTILNLKEN